MSSFHIKIARLASAFSVLAFPSGAASGEPDAALCLEAAAIASEESGVPYDVLLAVSMVETGRDGQPWPWTINIGGKGHWPDTAEQAEALVQLALEQGLTNVDLGCFQLNLNWHAGSFVSIRDMLDPQRNASYAAAFLAEKYVQTGDWSMAAAAYHSTTPEHAETYQLRFEETLAMLPTDGLSGLKEMSPKVNQYPLLIAGQSGSRGSLVPMMTGRLRLIGDP